MQSDAATVEQYLAELSAEHPAVKGNLLHALARVVPTHLLDRGLLTRLGTAHGRDPWIEEEEAECGEASGSPAVVGSLAEGLTRERQGR